MIEFACIWILAATTRVDVVNRVYQIPPREWRYVELAHTEKPVQVVAQYRVETGSGPVRLALLTRPDLDRLWKGLSHDVVDETSAADNGSIHSRLLPAGDYVLVVDNRGGEAARVQIHVALEVALVTQLPRDRQLKVILISFAVFFGIVTWSAHRLLRNIQR